MLPSQFLITHIYDFCILFLSLIITQNSPLLYNNASLVFLHVFPGVRSYYLRIELILQTYFPC